MSQRPAAIGMMVCDQVIIEESTKNVTPVNCFTRRMARQFPSDPFGFVVFAILTDGNGDIRLDLVIRRLENLDDNYEHSMRVHFASPLQEGRCLFRIRGLSYPDSGAYEVLLLADGEIIAQRKIRVTEEE